MKHRYSKALRLLEISELKSKDYEPHVDEEVRNKLMSLKLVSLRYDGNKFIYSITKNGQILLDNILVYEELE